MAGDRPTLHTSQATTPDCATVNLNRQLYLSLDASNGRISPTASVLQLPWKLAPGKLNIPRRCAPAPHVVLPTAPISFSETLCHHYQGIMLTFKRPMACTVAHGDGADHALPRADRGVCQQPSLIRQGETGGAHPRTAIMLPTLSGSHGQVTKGSGGPGRGEVRPGRVCVRPLAGGVDAMAGPGRGSGHAPATARARPPAASSSKANSLHRCPGAGGRGCSVAGTGDCQPPFCSGGVPILHAAVAQWLCANGKRTFFLVFSANE